MIYVPCIVHVMYWLGKGKGPLSSLILFEMPVIFYISGATMYVVRKRRTFKETVKNRAKRLLMPYYFFVIVCLAMLGVEAMIRHDYAKIASISVWKILLAQDDCVPFPFIWHLWFVMPYLIVACSFPFQQRLAEKVNRNLYMLMLLAGCVAITPLSTLSPMILKPVREALYYNLFFMAGYLYYKQASLKTILVATTSAIAIAASLLWYEWYRNGAIDIQSHKFPPDLLFVVFGVCSIGLLSLAFGTVKLPQNRLLRHWNKYGYTIYLWQNFSFLAYVIVCERFGLNRILSGYPIVDFVVASIIIVVFSTAISMLVNPLEKKFIKVCEWLRRRLLVL